MFYYFRNNWDLSLRYQVLNCRENELSIETSAIADCMNVFSSNIILKLIMLDFCHRL